MKQQKILASLKRFNLFLLQSILVACSSGEIAPHNFESNESIDLSPKHTTELLKNQTDFNRDIRAFIEQVMLEDGLPGAAIAIISQDEILLAEGFGFRDLEQQLPVTPETLFHIGSTNKSMTAMMIATLVDEEIFDWDTPVIEIYPEFQLSSPAATETVTMRHLLSMQSGIPDDAENDFDADYSSAEDVFDYVADVPLLGLPGEEFSYSNLSVSIAGYLGAIATENTQPNLHDGYTKLLRQKVLDPIGMKTAVVPVSEARKNPHYGLSYIMENGRVIAAEPEDFDGDPLAPAGVLKANVLDMAAYLSTQINRGIAPNGNRIVSAKNLTETWQPELENYGMGWVTKEYEGVLLLSHEGLFDNYLSVIGFIPELNIGFVVLTNSADAGQNLVTDFPSFLIEQIDTEF